MYEVQEVEDMETPQLVITLNRTVATSTYTLGTMQLPSGFMLATIERPWKNNAPNLSCIPAGTYTVRMTYSPRFKRYLYEVTGVHGRAGIRIHVANWAAELHGCIAVGIVHGPSCVLQSTVALRRLHDELKSASFQLHIHDTTNGAH